MTKMISIFKYEYILLKRNRLLAVVFVFIIAISLYALNNGRSYYKKQIDTIARLEQQEKAFFDTAASELKKDTATEDQKKNYKRAAKATWAIFTHKFYVYNRPSDLSVLCIGNRDVYPYYQEILPISLYMRLFKTEIANPFVLLTGNIDFSYVIIFLLPLLIIALTFNIIADDIELKIAPLINSNALSVYRYYFFKYLFYAFLVAALLILLFLIGLFFIPAHFPTGIYFRLLTESFLYALFWLIISFAVNMLRLSSVFNLSILLGCWVLFAVLIPSLFNQVTVTLYPIKTEAISNNIRRVQLDDKKENLQRIVNHFYKQFPEYATHIDTSADALFDRAYLAQGKMNDIQGDSLLNELCKNMRLKEGFLNRVAFFDPSMLLQKSFATITGTNLSSYIAYLQLIQKFNVRVKKFYFDRAFTTDKVTAEDYRKNIPHFSN